MTVETLLLMLAPLVVWAVTELVKWLLPKVSGALIVGIIVPVLSAGAALLATTIKPELSWLLQFLYGLIAVFVNELIRQLKQVATQAP